MFNLTLVEGQTEERFVKTVLNPHLEAFRIVSIPTIITTKLVKRGPNFKGGVPEYGNVRRQIQRLLGDTNASSITTMIDYYGLPNSFPGKTTIVGGTPHERVAYLEQEISKDIDDPRFHPYYSLHEFEAILFSSPQEIANTMIQTTSLVNLQTIKNSFSTPEDINDNPTTCPSGRLLNLFDTYNKPIYGSLISQNIGLETIRAECPHFNEWITRFENLQN
ncbi:MAG: DUF4276 family protein [Bacteroidota bacterium]|nr:DUF4276 family protein [Bacteroidota bacterium]